MTVLVLEEEQGDLVHHQRILETIPGVRLALFFEIEAAAKMYAEHKVDVLVIDDGIPDGALAFVKQIHLATGRRDVPVIVLTANGDKEARRAAYEYGIYNVIEKPIDPASYLCIARNALSMQVMRRRDSTNLTKAVEQYRELETQIEAREVQVIYALLHAANLVDAALSRRMVKVAAVALRIAHRIPSLGHEDARRLGIAARVYDVGFIALSPAVRDRRLELTGADAARLLGPHAERSSEIFPKDRSGLVELAATIARQHHERFDGRGYPDGLQKGDISIYAQIVSVAEAFEDATSVGFPSQGRAAMPLSSPQALSFIERQTGTAFDPKVVEGLRHAVASPLEEPPLAAPAR